MKKLSKWIGRKWSRIKLFFTPLGVFLSTSPGHNAQEGREARKQMAAAEQVHRLQVRDARLPGARSGKACWCRPRPSRIGSAFCAKQAYVSELERNANDAVRRRMLRPKIDIEIPSGALGHER